MKRLWLFAVLFAIASSMNCFAQSPILMDFSGDSAEANGVTIIGAGFGEYPMPDVSFGDIPTDGAFKDATDGRGMIITADPGEGLMILSSPISTTNCAILRCSIRLSAPHASLYLASVDQGDSAYVSTITPTNPSEFVNKYNRLANLFLPPSTGFQGIIQIINTSKSDSLTVYLDNFEAIPSDVDNIDFTMENIIGAPEQPTFTPTPTPNAGEIPLIHHWTFDEGRSKTASDATGDNDSIVNATWMNGHMNGAVYFDGNGAFVDPAEPIYFGASFKISLWMYWKKATNPWKVGCLLACKNYLSIAVHNTGEISFFIGDGSIWGNKTFIPAGYLVESNWYYLEAVYNNNQTYLHVTGNGIDEEAYESNTLDIGKINIHIGSMLGTYKYPFKGTIDDVKIYAGSPPLIPNTPTPTAILPTPTKTPIVNKD